MKKIFYIILVFIPFLSKCQERVEKNVTQKGDNYLYLLMCASNDNYSQQRLNNQIYDEDYLNSDTSFLSILWRKEKDKLVIVDTLNFDWKRNNEVSLCRHFDEFQWIIIGEEAKETAKKYSLNEDYIGPFIDKSYYSALDYSDGKLVLRKMDRSLFKPMFSYSGYGNCFLVDSEFYYEYTQDDNDKDYGNYAINRFFDKVMEVEEKTYRDERYLKYESGLYYRNQGGFPISSNGDLVFNFERGKPHNEWTKVNIDVPNKRCNNDKYFSFGFNYYTPDGRYWIGSRIADKPDFYNSTKLKYIYDRKENSWDSITLPVVCTNINVYQDEYMYGTARNENFKNYYDSVQILMQGKIKKYTTRYGNYPNLSIYTGKFFIYHIPSKKFIEYKAKDQDCELIQIVDDWIYYRVYDELRRMKLNTDQVDFEYNTDELIYKDKDIIPNVHHIFWAKKQPLKVEWITPKPEKKSRLK